MTTALSGDTLKSRFPTLYAECVKAKERCVRPCIITHNGITFDTVGLCILSQSEIDKFIELQKAHPDIINECFEQLIKLLGNHEILLNAKTRKEKKQIEKFQSNDRPMDKIYSMLLTICPNLEQVDKFVLFLKSQGEFSSFY
jgi:hypothetical protein